MTEEALHDFKHVPTLLAILSWLHQTSSLKLLLVQWIELKVHFNYTILTQRTGASCANPMPLALLALVLSLLLCAVWGHLKWNENNVKFPLWRSSRLLDTVNSTISLEVLQVSNQFVLYT